VSRRPAKFSQADVARVLRAAKQEGAAGIDVLPDGTIRVVLRNDYELAARNRSAQTDDPDEWGQVQA
jgi:hypothetical protein